jgi:hypothetical protein
VNALAVRTAYFQCGFHLVLFDKADAAARGAHVQVIFHSQPQPQDMSPEKHGTQDQPGGDAQLFKTVGEQNRPGLRHRLSLT